MRVLPTASSSPPPASRKARLMRSKRTLQSASVGPRKAASSCLGMGRPHDHDEGGRSESGGCCTNRTLWPPGRRLDALVADGSNLRFPIGCVRLSRGPTSVAEPFRQNGHVHGRALSALVYGAGLF